MTGPEPKARVIGEEQVVAEADRLVANTRVEAGDLIARYDADPRPGVDRRARRGPGPLPSRVPATPRRPGSPPGAASACPTHGYVVAFVGRIQPLKAPDVLVRAVAALRERDPALAEEVTVVIAGGPSGSGLDRPTALIELAASLGVADRVRFLPPQTGEDLPALYRAADLVAVPSHNESFGLVALEAQACGTPVLAAAVGGLVTAVRTGSAVCWSTATTRSTGRGCWPGCCRRPATGPSSPGARCGHARNFSWTRTVAGLLAVYREAIAERRSDLAARFAGAPCSRPPSLRLVIAGRRRRCPASRRRAQAIDGRRVGR